MGWLPEPGIVIAFPATGVDIRAPVPAGVAVGGEGGVCVALICFVFVGCGDPDLNILLRPKCIEQEDSKSAIKGTKIKIEYFFIYLQVMGVMLYQMY